MKSLLLPCVLSLCAVSHASFGDSARVDSTPKPQPSLGSPDVPAPSPSVAPSGGGKGAGIGFSLGAYGVRTLPSGPSGAGSYEGSVGFRVTPGIAFRSPDGSCTRIYLGYEHAGFETKSSSSSYFGTTKMSLSTSQSISADLLTFGFGSQQRFLTDAMFYDGGVSLDIPLSSTIESKVAAEPDPLHMSSSTSGSYDANVAVYGDLLLGVKLTPSVSILGGLRGNIYPFAGDFLDENAVNLLQFTFGVRYDQ